MQVERKIKLLTGNSHPQLSAEIAECLELPLSKAKVSAFSDGEVRVAIEENVRGVDLFIVKSTCAPVNQNLMELLIMIDAARRASASRITAVIPYYGYARQDRKDRPRVPITSKLVANLLVAAGANRVLCMDLHADQIQGFFDIPVDHLYAMPVIIDYLKERAIDNCVVVAPDAGGVERARGLARRLVAPLAIVDKRRPQPNVAEILNIIGEVKGKNAIIVDDMVDTAGTLTLVAQAIKNAGATSVRAVATHAVLSGPAVERIEKSILEELVVTNSIPLGDKAHCKKISSLSVARILAEAIKRIHFGESVSSLFIE